MQAEGGDEIPVLQSVERFPQDVREKGFVSSTEPVVPVKGDDGVHDVFGDFPSTEYDNQVARKNGVALFPLMKAQRPHRINQLLQRGEVCVFTVDAGRMLPLPQEVGAKQAGWFRFIRMRIGRY